jgi:hypothetical protein
MGAWGESYHRRHLCDPSSCCPVEVGFGRFLRQVKIFLRIGLMTLLTSSSHLGE